MLWAPSISPDTLRLDNVPTCVIVGCDDSIDITVPDLASPVPAVTCPAAENCVNTRSVVPIVNAPSVFILKPIFSNVVPEVTNENAAGNLLASSLSVALVNTQAVEPSPTVVNT